MLLRALIGCVSVFSILLVGCANFRNAAHPFRYVPPTHQSVYEAIDKTPIALDPSATYEKPLSLGEVIDIALTHNPDTKVSWNNAKIAAATYGESLQNIFPQLNFSADYKRDRSALFSTTSREIVYETAYGGSVELDYLLLDFGQTRLSSQSAKQALLAANWQHTNQVQETIYSAMQAYYDYLAEQQMTESLVQDEISAQTSYDAVLTKLSTGLADKSDEVQAKTALLQQQLNLTEQKQTQIVAYHKLMQTMGLPAYSDLCFLPFPPPASIYETQDLEEILMQALEHNPQYREAEAQLKSQQLALQSVIKSRLPQINLKSDLGRKYGYNGINDHYDWSIALNLSLPLFQGFFISNQIRQARAQVEEAAAKLTQAKVQLLQQIGDSFSQIKTSVEALVLAKQYLTSSEENYAINLQKYRVGTTTILDLISAQSSLADSRARLVTNQKEVYIAIITLVKNTGMLLPSKRGGK